MKVDVKWQGDKIYIPGLFNDKLNISRSFYGETYSASFIKNFNNCQANTVFSALQESTGRPLIIGSKTHEFLEKVYSDENVTENDIDNEITAKKLDVDTFMIHDIKKYVKAYFKINPYEGYNKDALFLTEKFLKHSCSPLSVELPAKLLGYIDRIDISDNGNFVIDYKTSSREVDINNYLDQMIIYGWLFKEEFGFNADGLFIASLYQKNPKYIEIKPTLEDQSKLIDKIFNTHDKILESNKTCLFDIKSSWTCRFCPFEKECKNKTDFSIKIDNKLIKEEKEEDKETDKK